MMWWRCANSTTSSKHSRGGVELHPEAPLIPVRYSAAKCLGALIRRILVIGDLLRRSLQRLHNMGRGGKVWIADPQADEIDPLASYLIFHFVDFCKQIRGEAVQSLGQFDA